MIIPVEFAEALQTPLTADGHGAWRPLGAFASSASYPAEAAGIYSSAEDHTRWFRHRNADILCALGRFPPDGTLRNIVRGNGMVARELGQLERAESIKHGASLLAIGEI